MKKHPLICVTLLMTFLYIFLFILIPLIEPFWRDAEDTLYPSMLIVFGFGMLFVTDRLRYWFLGDILFTILIFIYHKKGAYDIGVVPLGLFDYGYREDVVPIEIVLCGIVCFVVQIFVLIVIKLYKRTHKRKKNASDDL